jgi:hypothetical protein
LADTNFKYTDFVLKYTHPNASPEEVEDIIIISWGVGGLTNVQVRLSIFLHLLEENMAKKKSFMI